MWDFHLQNHQHFDTFVTDFKEKRLKIKLKYEHEISHVSYVRAHPNLTDGESCEEIDVLQAIFIRFCKPLEKRLSEKVVDFLNQALRDVMTRTSETCGIFRLVF